MDNQTIDPASRSVTVLDKRTANVVDSEGRVLKVRTLSAVQRMKLFGAAGPEKSLVDRYMAYSIMAASVVEIDAQLIPFPRSAGEAEAIVNRLDDHGLTAVAQALAALRPEEEDVAAAAENM